MQPNIFFYSQTGHFILGYSVEQRLSEGVIEETFNQRDLGAAHVINRGLKWLCHYGFLVRGSVAESWLIIIIFIVFL